MCLVLFPNKYYLLEMSLSLKFPTIIVGFIVQQKWKQSINLEQLGLIVRLIYSILS